MIRQGLAMAFVTFLTIVSAHAQKIQTMDSEGNAIPMVTVLTEDGVYIGTTDLNGILADVEGATKVALTHIAYKSQLVTVASLTDGRVTMEDVDYGLKEVVVTPKPYLYKEYYYRAFCYIGDSLRAYGAGVVPVAHDISSNYKAQIRPYWHTGTFANMALMWHESKIKGIVEDCIKDKSYQTFEHRNKDKDIQEMYRTTIVGDGPNRWRVEIPTKEVVGQIVHSGGLNRTTIDGARSQMYSDQIHGRDKLLKRRQEKNYQYQYVSVYKLDDDEETPDITRHVMTMHDWSYDSNKGRMKEIYYIYTIDYGYKGKDEYKARCKELNKGHIGDLTLAKLQDYERSHHVPELAPEQLQAIQGLKRGQGKKK
ncbi:MAG: hypothetical protein K6C30_00235 [Bacteroidaceae bacterium]|nr:hypothetical protein [Bacteroidaceae bacterium]